MKNIILGTITLVLLSGCSYKLPSIQEDAKSKKDQFCAESCSQKFNQDTRSHFNNNNILLDYKLADIMDYRHCVDRCE